MGTQTSLWIVGAAAGTALALRWAWAGHLDQKEWLVVHCLRSVHRAARFRLLCDSALLASGSLLVAAAALAVEAAARIALVTDIPELQIKEAASTEDIVSRILLPTAAFLTAWCLWNTVLARLFWSRHHWFRTLRRLHQRPHDQHAWEKLTAEALAYCTNDEIVADALLTVSEAGHSKFHSRLANLWDQDVLLSVSRTYRGLPALPEVEQVRVARQRLVQELREASQSRKQPLLEPARVRRAFGASLVRALLAVAAALLSIAAVCAIQAIELLETPL